MGFFTPEPLLYHASAEGFALFGPGHLLSLILSGVLVSLSVCAYLRLPRGSDGSPSGPRRTLLHALAGLPCALVAAKCLTYRAYDIFEPLFWPLHICNLCEYAALAYAVQPRSAVGSRAGDLLFCWGLTGCPAALLLPGWHPYCPALSAASICGFAEHALVFACALCLAASGDHVPRPRGLLGVLLLSAGCGLLFRLVNPLLGTNFFFVTNPAAAGGPLAWLVTSCGDPGFLAPYLGIAACSWLLLCGICRKPLRDPHTPPDARRHAAS